MNFKIILCWICVFWGIGVLEIQAQDIELSGLVSDRQTGNTLEMANVILYEISRDDTTGTTTDGNGLYEFNQLQPGNYILSVRYVGFETYSDTLKLAERDERVLKNVQLFRSSESLDEIVISGVQEDVEVGRVSINPQDLRRVPTPAGSADLAGYLQAQPGVVATGDRGGQLFIRGGTPSENLVLVDGIQIYQPFHILGFFSAFSEEILSKVDLYAGGFGAEYSGRTSSVMDVRLKNGNLYNRNWSASVSPFVSELFFESPVIEGKNSIMVSARGSLIEESSKLYLEEQQPFRFNNQLVKFTNIGERASCSALFMRTYDRGKLDFDGDEFFKWNNFVLGGRCSGSAEGSSVSFYDLNVGISYFSNEAGSPATAGRFSDVYKSHVDVNFTQSIGEWKLDYGFFTDYRIIDYDISDRFLSTQERKASILSSGFHATADVPIGEKISIEPGIAVTAYIRKYKTSLEPRLQLSWQPRGKVDEEVHAALGIYRQPLIGVSDFRDAGTAFTAWMPIPDSTQRLKARHALLGWRQPVGDYIDFSVEGYYKDIQYTPVTVWSPLARFSTNLAYANGTSHGADVRLNFNYRNLYLGVGYGYSYTEYKTAQGHFGTWFGEPVQRYHPPHDRRHQVNTQAGLEFGKFRANISWVYGSGLPYTRPLGFDSFFSFDKRPPEVGNRYGDPRILVDKPYEGRLPDFHRLDISVEQAFEFPGFRTRVQAGAINAYNLQNLFYYDVFNQRGIKQLSFMPYFSLKVESI